MSVEASASDSYVRLTEASYAVDGKRWVPVFPADGLFDGKAETFRFRTEVLPAGAHVVVLKVRDAAGNTGSADAVLQVTASRPTARRSENRRPLRR